MWLLTHFGTPWIRPHSLYFQIYRAFVGIDTLNILAKFEVSSFNRGYLKISEVPGYANAPFSPKFLCLWFAWTLWIYLPNLNFVALPIPEIIGNTEKNFGSPCICPRSIFSQHFKRLLFGWTPWIHLPNLKFVALSVPEIIGGTSKNLGSPWIRPWGVPGFAHAPYSPKF